MIDIYHYFLQAEGPQAMADYYGYGRDEISFNPSREQAAADSANRHDSEDWATKEKQTGQTLNRVLEPLPF